MTHKALVRRLQISCLGLDHVDPLRLLVDDVIEALRENAMREVQRLGQEIEQEPVAWGNFKEDGTLVGLSQHPEDQANWTNRKPLYTTPPQRTERPVDCERCNRLEEQAYDLVGKLRVANIKLSMQPQRTWVGLTDEDKKQMAKEANYHWEMTAGEYAERIGQLTEAKLKEKNT